jgi:hypothetical protein
MKTHRIDIKPAGSGRAHMYWRAGPHGSTVYLNTSRRPLFDAARLLVKLGVDPNDHIETWRSNTKCLSGPVWAAAKLTIKEETSSGTPRFAIWRPFPEDMSGR